MGDIRWTPDQQRAIETRGRHLLVSAAAGSGKTAVLVERIVRRITVEGGDIDRLLVVTFTDAAATQMRDRIVQVLEDRLAAAPGDTHLLRQLMLLPGASISTLHSFCLAVVRQHFYRLGLDPSFRVMDEHEAQLLRLEVLEDVLEDAYEQIEPDAPFARLVTAYGGGRSDESLQRFILEMHDYSRSLPDPQSWLKNSIAAYKSVDADTFAESPWAAELTMFVDVQLARAQRMLQRALTLAQGPGGAAAHAETLVADLERLEALREVAAQGWSRLVEKTELFTFPRMKPARGEDIDPDVRSVVTDIRKKARELLYRQVRDKLLSRPLDEEIRGWRQVAPQLQALVETVLRFDEAYTAAKNERGLVDFGDIEHLCLKLLQDEVVAAEVGERFDEVLIDECQDLNGVQDAILSRIARPAAEGGELFLVGDVKQSVYRFRQADPGLFLARYERASPDPAAPEQRIDLQANFRSRPNILAAVNFLFRQLMTEAAAEMHYGPEAELVPGAHFDPEVSDLPVELHLLERDESLLAAGTRGDDETMIEDDEEDLSAFQREAVYTVQRIEQLVRHEKVSVWDNRLGRYRPARYGDIVILLRAMSNRANELLDVLSAAGIPAYAELGTGYFAATEVETMLSLLSVLDNPRQDIPLAAVLRSAIVGLSAKDLARLRLQRRDGDLYDAVVASATEETPLGERARQFLNRLDRWRTIARRAPLSKLVWTLFAETRYFDYVGVLPGGRQRQANLRALYDRARQFNHFSRHGLSRFLRFVDRLRDADGDLGTAPALGEGDDVVRIMTVHKSKGLEFPIVFVLDAGRGFKGRGGHPDLTVQRSLGLGAAVVDGARRIAQPSLLREAVLWRRRREELAEEMRVLYVALTRARERLIIVGSCRDMDAKIADWAQVAGHVGWSLPDESLLSAANWLDWIGPAVLRHAQGEPLRARVQGDVPLGDREVANDPSSWQLHIAGTLDVGSVDDPFDKASVPWDLVSALHPFPFGEKHSALDEAAAAVDLTDEGRSPKGATVLQEVPRETHLTDGVSVDFWQTRLRRRIDWQYPWQAVVGKVAKQSVSELKRRWDAIVTEETEPVSSFKRRLDERPVFLQAAGRPLTAAERGSAVHVMLQHVDLKAALDRQGLLYQMQRLVERQMLTPEQANAVPLDQLQWFFASALGRKLQQHADSVQREVPFTMALPAAEAYPDLDPDFVAQEHVVVQGIIDCLLQDGDELLLLDFKTDRVSKANVLAAAARYDVQMRLYKRAVEQMLGRPVKEAYLVFLTARHALAV